MSCVRKEAFLAPDYASGARSSLARATISPSASTPLFHHNYSSQKLCFPAHHKHLPHQGHLECAERLKIPFQLPCTYSNLERNSHFQLKGKTGTKNKHPIGMLKVNRCLIVSINRVMGCEQIVHKEQSRYKLKIFLPSKKWSNTHLTFVVLRFSDLTQNREESVKPHIVLPEKAFSSISVTLKALRKVQSTAA